MNDFAKRITLTTDETITYCNTHTQTHLPQFISFLFNSFFTLHRVKVIALPAAEPSPPRRHRHRHRHHRTKTDTHQLVRN